MWTEVGSINEHHVDTGAGEGRKKEIVWRHCCWDQHWEGRNQLHLGRRSGRGKGAGVARILHILQWQALPIYLCQPGVDSMGPGQQWGEGKTGKKLLRLDLLRCVISRYLCVEISWTSWNSQFSLLYNISSSWFPGIGKKKNSDDKELQISYFLRKGYLLHSTFLVSTVWAPLIQPLQSTAGNSISMG